MNPPKIAKTLWPDEHCQIDGVLCVSIVGFLRVDLVAIFWRCNQPFWLEWEKRLWSSGEEGN